MKYLTLLVITLSSNLYSQSIYLVSPQNTFSGAFGFSSFEESSAKAYGISYTIKGTVNFGVTYITSEQEYENKDYTGTGFGGYASIMLQNELIGNPYNLEIGLFLEETTSKTKFDLDSIESHSFGLALIASKSLTTIDSPNSFILQFGGSVVPISESLVSDRFSRNQRLVSPLTYQVFIIPSIVLFRNKILPIAIEPSFGYLPQFEIAIFSIGITGLFKGKSS